MSELDDRGRCSGCQRLLIEDDSYLECEYEGVVKII